MEKVEEDMVLACSVRRHGLENWEMVAAEFSNSISKRFQCILQYTPVECQVKYESLKGHFKSLYQTNFTEEEDDESGFINLMADKLTKTYRDYWTEQVKLGDTPLQKKSPNIFKQEAKERIKLNEEKGDDKSNEKMENINQAFIKFLNVVRSHKHCYLFESRLPSQYSIALELRANIMREMGKKPLFCRKIVCGLPAAGNPMFANQKLEKRAYKARNKAQEGESTVMWSVRVRNKLACEFKNDPDYDYKGQQRRTTKKK
ncbi:hypothetical protein MTR67_000716 [Solanum verrucosum]|uniref:Myb-like domain-containing protein n=1 Tax=Solanum verrucosum TaxID=315347 RepID=A0AAF0PRA2_SOLVR|nr:hypothetical protein MTR67_000716 [Solanum verrucosum]